LEFRRVLFRSDLPVTALPCAKSGRNRAAVAETVAADLHGCSCDHESASLPERPAVVTRAGSPGGPRRLRALQTLARAGPRTPASAPARGGAARTSRDGPGQPGCATPGTTRWQVRADRPRSRPGGAARAGTGRAR